MLAIELCTFGINSFRNGKLCVSIVGLKYHNKINNYDYIDILNPGIFIFSALKIGKTYKQIEFKECIYYP